METTVNDPAFGLMEYDALWEKKDSIDIFGSTFKIIISASDLDEEGINEIQQETYLKVKDTFVALINENIPKILDFCIENYEEVEGLSMSQILAELKPVHITFERDGIWAILFEVSYDIDNGIVMIFEEEEEVKVDFQDSFL